MLRNLSLVGHWKLVRNQSEQVYWQILLAFTLDDENLLGEATYVQLRNMLPDDFLTSKKNMDVQLVSF